mmetsp:Transcript_18579/g.46355  ORF Transcript_18579/g.46355 Transcript_18579/m.46355 type:complete len:227 (-) Transcript_18579:666-1346(-)|eukprot:CAMPEP_0179000804 /NCGR_PEP_ID=MMETSP0795-20121207/10924_1 /TAXON_ID=88552 /ORGANISM="Amoebophrya sp., Strain Ameob2" /LENGTH=226 /DNA_ID=CAMNT_0020693939 /DNA_START=105 /DNA_END=785 /DNA_ORIENTATION=+
MPSPKKNKEAEDIPGAAGKSKKRNLARRSMQQDEPLVEPVAGTATTGAGGASSSSKAAAPSSQNQNAANPNAPCKRLRQILDDKNSDYLVVPREWVRIKAPGRPEPGESYEMSSDAENSDQSPNREKKDVPKWCENWVKEVEGQAKIDPDTVFGGNMVLVDLEDVFGVENPDQPSKRGRRLSEDARADPQRRWHRDKLRKEEVINYTQVMGQTERMDHLWRKPGDK